MTRFNLSEWALRHRALVRFLIIAAAVIGVLSFGGLGQSEDPPFTFKVMVIRTHWPGASAREIEQQVTDRIEKKLQEAPYLDYVRSYSKPGESLVYFVAKDSTPPSEMPNVFYQVRKKIGDIRHTLPPAVQGPFFDDEFGDTYGNLYALTGEGFGYSQLKDYADPIRNRLLRLKDVAKVTVFGEQDEKVFIELSNSKLATLGVDLQTIFAALAQQNAVVATGSFETPSDRVYVRVSGAYADIEHIREVRIRAGGREFRIGDIARVWRGYVDPPQPKTRYMGTDALIIGISMAKGGDIIELGERLTQDIDAIRRELPVGLELHQVASQPKAVQRSINEFLRSLAEAVGIVLLVTFFSLGFRTGLVVALAIPLVLALTFLFMYLFDVGLHKISLGTLVLALGLLVDDAIIAVEMMAVKMEQGWERLKAASFAYTSTAMPMLTGTLVTAAGFLPIATAASSTGEYTRSIFQVSVIALLVSWFAAVIVIPYLGSRLIASPKPSAAARDELAVYRTPFYRRFRALVEWCIAHRASVIAATLALFILSLYGFRFVQQQFFPSSTRLELLIDLRLPEGASFTATEAEVKKLEAILAREHGIENYVAYVGSGSPRFYLPIQQQLPEANFAQFVVLATSIEAREALRLRLIELFDNEFTLLRANIARLENGPPVGYPVQFRISGDDFAILRRYAYEMVDAIRQNPHVSNVHMDWNELAKVVRVELDQSKLRAVQLSSQDVANFLSTSLNGFAVSSMRERDKTIEILLRGAGSERTRLEFLPDLMVPTRAGQSVPLAQLGGISYGFEEGVVWRRNRLPTITVRANIYGDIQAPSVAAQIEPMLDSIRARLPHGFRIETGGALEESAKGQASVAAGVPLFALAVLTLLMIQLQSFRLTLLVVLTAPLGMIGVTAILLAFNQPFGFVAMLGTIAMCGMIMRHAVILVDQIEQDMGSGRSRREAVVEATVRRFRPIVVTAAAAVLAMVPLTRSAFFEQMAFAIMGGLVAATALTLLFLPALYAAWFGIDRSGQRVH